MTITTYFTHNQALDVIEESRLLGLWQRAWSKHGKTAILTPWHADRAAPFPPYLGRWRALANFNRSGPVLYVEPNVFPNACFQESKGGFALPSKPLCLMDPESDAAFSVTAKGAAAVVKFLLGMDETVPAEHQAAQLKQPLAGLQPSLTRPCLARYPNPDWHEQPMVLFPFETMRAPVSETLKSLLGI